MDDDFVNGLIDTQKLREINNSPGGLKVYVISNYWYAIDRKKTESQKSFLGTLKSVGIDSI
jgi:hypothetical protein